MNRIFIILFFVPFVSYSQVKSFDELKKINSPDQFRRVAIENNYKKNNTMINDSDTSIYLSYGVNLKLGDRGYNVSPYWAEYFISDTPFEYAKKDEWIFQYADLQIRRNEGIYHFDRIVEQIKDKCSFFDILENYDGEEYVTYSCPGSSYKGKIGYTTKDGDGFIAHFLRYD
jgi:hypothetical protein